MRKFTFLMAFALCLCFTMKAATVLPYLPQADNFGGADVNASTFVPSSGNYTLEVTATAGTEISLAGIVKYTPEATGKVRFAQKGGKVYVYEGNVYKVTLTPDYSQATTFTDIFAEADGTGTGIYNALNIIQNPGFESNLTLLVTGRYKDGVVWNLYNSSKVEDWNVGSGNSIREGGKPEGTHAILMHSTGTYLTQTLEAGKIKPNTPYKIKYNYQSNAANQNNATYRVEIGTAQFASDICASTTYTTPANTNSQIFEYTFVTPANVVEGDPTYFAIHRTIAGTNTANQNLDYIDRVSMVEGTIAAGIVGATSPVYVDGSAFAPEYTLASGEIYDMTEFIANPSFEETQADKSQTIPGWTKTGSANSEYCTRSDAGPTGFKTGNVYFQYWSSSRPDYSIYQELTGLPKGRYTLLADAGGTDNTTRGTFVYAGTSQVEVTETKHDYSVDVVVLDGTLTIGFKSVSRTVSWSYADNFRLHYVGALIEPILSIPAASVVITEAVPTYKFTVSGENLIEDVVLAAPAGLTLTPSTISAADAATGVEVTVTWDKATAVNGQISASSGSVNSDNIITVSAVAETFVPKEGNVTPDAYMNNLGVYGGWGNKKIVTVADEPGIPYSGASCAKIQGTGVCWPDGASIDINNIAWEAGKKYKVSAMIKTMDGSFALEIKGAGLPESDDQGTASFSVDTSGEWELFEKEFTAAATTATGGCFFNNCSTSTGMTGYIDNWEIYEVANTVGVDDEMSVETAINVYVNNGNIVADINLSAADVVEIVVYDVRGAVLSKEAVSLSAGRNQQTINANLLSGIYLVKVVSEGKTAVQKVVK